MTSATIFATSSGVGGGASDAIPAALLKHLGQGRVAVSHRVHVAQSSTFATSGLERLLSEGRGQCSAPFLRFRNASIISAGSSFGERVARSSAPRGRRRGEIEARQSRRRLHANRAADGPCRRAWRASRGWPDRRSRSGRRSPLAAIAGFTFASLASFRSAGAMLASFHADAKRMAAACNAASLAAVVADDQRSNGAEIAGRLHLASHGGVGEPAHGLRRSSAENPSG